VRLRIADAFTTLPIAIGPIGIVHADCALASWSSFKAGLDVRIARA
jgi:hypothetical protein